ncbi:unnamed protein product [Microthlaspi erraticum]|uniref:MATH domain-containing protein n=1 Tax=Microthlaspi erraticum TaxID=1685480 RepID=A0A6D2IV85_9BRAS|nr:unnamed protein product [Microthlaspi erraticum]
MPKIGVGDPSPNIPRSRLKEPSSRRGILGINIPHRKLEGISMMSSSISSTTLQSWRERSPSSYTLKIQNFSQFLKSTPTSDDKYQSGLFSSGGYKWRMIVYPKGNDKDSGNGFISMYLEIDRTSLMSTPPSEVFADLRFLVYNKKENKYFTIQDVESKPFNTLRTIWGLPQVLQLDTLKDPENGYIFEGDQCEFGVDVIVAPPPTKWEQIFFNERPSNAKFSWTVKNFFEVKEDPLSSNIFSMGGRNWVLKLYIKGETRRDGKWLSTFLFLAGSETMKEDEKIYTRAHLRVLDPFGNNDITKELLCWHNNSKSGWGRPHFMSIAELREAYLDKEGTLSVEIELEVVSTTNFYPII